MLAYMTKPTTIKLDDPSADAAVRRVFHSAGAGDSGRQDLSERMEELLAGPAEGCGVLADDEGQRFGPVVVSRTQSAPGQTSASRPSSYRTR
jgi:hypothetical protein